MGGNVRATVTWHAPKGWRMMDPALTSNQPVPVRQQQVTIQLFNGVAPLGTATSTTTDGNGVASITDNAAANMVRVTDRFGNVHTAAIP
jgi:hypothetical protein